MATIHWLTAINGSFTNPADWSGGAVPGAGDDAVIDATGAPYTVAASGKLTVGDVQVGGDATLAIEKGRFTVSDSTGSTMNAGVILVGAGATFVVQRTIVNTGAIEIAGSHGRTGRAAFRFAAPGGYFTGGGEVILEGGRSVLGQEGAVAPTLMTNVDNTIMGSGIISSGTRSRLINQRAGVIDATGATPLSIHTYVADYGLVEATGAGGLSIQALSLYIRPHATLFAGDGSSVKLNVLETSVGGTFASAGSGVIMASQSGFYSGGYGMTNDADLTLQNCKFGNQAYPFKIANNDTIHLMGTLAIGATTTLNGDGPTYLDGAEIVGLAGASLTLASGAISGPGLIEAPGTGAWGLAIAAGAVIDNPGAQGLAIDPGAAVIENAGTIASTGAGGVQIGGAVANTGLLTASAGALTLGSPSAAVSIMNAGVISATGGTVVAFGSVSGAGVAEIAAGILRFNAAFDQRVRFTGSSGALGLAQSQDFTSAISGFSRHGSTTLDLSDIAFVNADEASFSGGAASGVLTVTDGTHTARITLLGDYLSARFVAASDGGGGTNVTAHPAASATAPPQALAWAMAAMAGSPTSLEPPRGQSPQRPPVLAPPPPMLS